MRAVGIILAGGNNQRLGELTRTRAASALPVASSYRCIDFTLSNMTNSGIGKVAVITQYNARSLHDHLSSAKWWNFGRKNGGLYVFSPYLNDDNPFWFRGTADSIHQNLLFLSRSYEEYVVLCSGDTVFKADFSVMIDNHIESGADVTIVYKNATPDMDPKDYGVLSLDDEGNVLELEEKPLNPKSDKISLGVYIMKRELLISLLEEAVSNGHFELVRDVLVRYQDVLKYNGCCFEGYWRSINSIKAYYDINMDFLRDDVRSNFMKYKPFIETKAKDEPAAKYNAGADASDCLVGSGSIINGHVSHSVLFRSVFVGDHTSVRGSIIMEGSRVGNNCTLEYVIVDKYATISDGAVIIGEPDNPAVVPKGASI